MKFTSTLSLIIALSASSVAVAQSDGMNHNHMDMQDKQMSQTSTSATVKTTVHQAVAVVKAVNPEKGSVTLAHEAIQSLKWPAMTMNFVVKDAKLFDKLTVGKKVNIEIAQQGINYIVTTVK